MTAARRALRSWGPSQAARHHTAAVIEDAHAAQAALAGQRAERLDATIAHITGSLALWTDQDQIDALDAYLKVDRRARSLPRYAPYARAVKEASLILRAMPVPASPAPAAITHEAVPVPVEAEVWGWPETALPAASPHPSGPGNGLPPEVVSGGEPSTQAPAGPGPEVTSSPGSEGTATPDSGSHFLPAAGPEPGEVPARTLLRLKPGGDGGFVQVPRERAPRGGFGELDEDAGARFVAAGLDERRDQRADEKYVNAIFGDDASDTNDPGSGDERTPSPEPDQPAPAVGSAAGADAPGPDLDPAGSGPGEPDGHESAEAGDA